jgi:hypothetical protein
MPCTFFLLLGGSSHLLFLSLKPEKLYRHTMIKDREGQEGNRVKKLDLMQTCRKQVHHRLMY